MRREPRGFTLIELLIVVAIIAILAAIAVPNFLEAQTRAKVSRVRADIRSLATAQEAYYVDWNSYTFRNNGDDNPWRHGAWGGYRQLTTPIAYIGTIPLDPFGVTHSKLEWRPAALEMGTGVAGVADCGGAPWVGDTPDPRGYPSNTYEMESDGPDHYDDTESGHMPGNLDLSSGQYPWEYLADNDPSVAAILSLRYDPTNGTISPGEVYRCGGIKASGRPMDTFFIGGQ